jgi:hypothetical protein
MQRQLPTCACLSIAPTYLEDSDDENDDSGGVGLFSRPHVFQRRWGIADSLTCSLTCLALPQNVTLSFAGVSVAQFAGKQVDAEDSNDEDDSKILPQPLPLTREQANTPGEANAWVST